MRGGEASVLVSGGLAILAIVVAGWFVWAVRASGEFFGDTQRSLRRDFLIAVIVCVAWLAIPAMLAGSGALSDFKRNPPPLVLLVACCMAGGTIVAASPIGWRLAHGLSLSTLVGFHGFRLALELIMHQAAVEKVMPMQMSYSGDNFDIFSGIGAILMAALIQIDKGPRWLVWIWNSIGLALLATIAAIAVRSLPLFHAYGTRADQLNTWIADFPFVWLPTVLVSAAIFGHILVTRRLLDI